VGRTHITASIIGGLNLLSGKSSDAENRVPVVVSRFLIVRIDELARMRSGA
jgi:hypothetical protein